MMNILKVSRGARSFSTTSASYALKKVFGSSQEAIFDIKEGATVFGGGFGVCGVAEDLFEALQEKGTKNLTVVSNDCGLEDFGPGLLLHKHQIKRMILSYFGDNKMIERQYLNGELEVELRPQGTIAEAIRCGGSGVPAFYTPAGYGTLVQKGGFPIKYGPGGKGIAMTSPPKETRTFNGRDYIMELSMFADFSFVKAEKADELGNLVFHESARNFNDPMARAARITIAEVEEIVPIGALTPDMIHTPANYVARVFKTNKKKRIEQLRYLDPKAELPALSHRDCIARRAALEFQDGMVVNLGIGLPMLASNYVKPGVNVLIQSENGILGMGPYPEKGHEDPDIINAGKQTVTILPGGSAFSSDVSFGMIRGGHIGMTMLGGMEVSQFGDLANWMIPGKRVKGMGGAMDLVSSGSRVVVVMEHNEKKDGSAKIKKQCTLPLTGVNVVSRIITDKAVFDVEKTKGLTLIELSPEFTVDQIRTLTDAPFIVSDQLKPYQEC